MRVKQGQNQLSRKKNVLTSNLYLRFGILELQVLSPVIKKWLFQTFNVFLSYYLYSLFIKQNLRVSKLKNKTKQHSILSTLP